MAIDYAAHLRAPVPGEYPQRQRSFCRSFVQFLCSNLGLIIIVIGYCVGGAFLFALLEQYIELQNCQKGDCEWFCVEPRSSAVSALSLRSAGKRLDLEHFGDHLQLRGPDQR